MKTTLANIEIGTRVIVNGEVYTCTYMRKMKTMCQMYFKSELPGGVFGGRAIMTTEFELADS